MALTRKSLKAMGLSDEQVDSIVDMHSETVDGLKGKISELQTKADEYDAVKAELDKFKDGGDYKARYEQEHKEFEAFKKEVAGKELLKAKETAVREYFESKGITGQNLDIAMRGAKEEISAITLDGDKIKDSKSLDDLIGGTYAGLVIKKESHGASVTNPPANNGGGKMTREQIMAIKDAATRQKAIAENHELFGF